MNAADEEQVLIEIAVGQGNKFVQDFLRTHHARIGATKADFRKNLKDALDKVLVTADEIKVWLNDVEGWGDQHCYPLDVPDEIFDDEQWREVDFVQARVEAAGLAAKWHSARSLTFPENLQLETISLVGSSMVFTWQRGLEQQRRRPDLDYTAPALVNGEEIRFKAYSVNRRRLVVRFYWNTAQKVASILIPSSSDYGDYEGMRDDIIAQIRPVIDVGAWTQLNIPAVIRRLDQMASEGNVGALQVRPSVATFTGASSSVQMRSNLADGNYQDDEEILEVREAVVAAELAGNNGDFRLVFEGHEGAHIRLHGRDRSVLFWGQMRANEALAYIQEISALTA